MANEPERPIETLLRAAAKKRRDEAGPPFELHPATRRLLQGEVARKFAKPQRGTGSFFQALGQLWPRLAWGVAILAVLGVAARLLLPVPGHDKPETFLAKNQPVSEAAPAKESLPPPATAAPPPPLQAAPTAIPEPAAVALADRAQSARAEPARQLRAAQQPLADDGAAARNKREAEESISLAAAPQLADRQKPAEMQIATSDRAPAPAPAGSVNGALESRRRFDAKPAPAAGLPATPAAAPSVAIAPPAAKVVAASESAKLTGDKSDLPAAQYKSLGTVASANRVGQSRIAMDGLSKSAADALKETRAFGVAQQFVRVAPEAKDQIVAGKATPAHAVLASFQVEQAGQEVRVIDSDGSVYSGYAQAADATRRARAAQADAPAAGRASRALGVELKQKAAPSRDSERLAPQTYSFRVAGTNRSLNKSVVFTGDLLTISNLASSLPVSTNLSAGGGSRAYQSVPAQPGLLPLPNSRISGKVVIGTDKAVEINALPARP